MTPEHAHIEYPNVQRVVVMSAHEHSPVHVAVHVRGFGRVGQRPLLGILTCSPQEAAYLVALHGEPDDRP